MFGFAMPVQRRLGMPNVAGATMPAQAADLTGTGTLRDSMNNIKAIPSSMGIGPPITTASAPPAPPAPPPAAPVAPPAGAGMADGAGAAAGSDSPDIMQFLSALFGA